MGNRNTLLQNRKNWLSQFPNDADRMPRRAKYPIHFQLDQAFLDTAHRRPIKLTITAECSHGGEKLY